MFFRSSLTLVGLVPLVAANRFLVRECVHYEIERTTTSGNSENVYNLTGKVVDSAAFLVSPEFYGYKYTNNTFGIPERKDAMAMCVQVVSHGQLRAFGANNERMRNFLTQPAVIKTTADRLPVVALEEEQSKASSVRVPDLAEGSAPAAPPANVTEFFNHEKLRKKKLPQIKLNRKWTVPDFFHANGATAKASKETHILEDVVPWGYKKLRKTIDVFRAVPVLAEYIARAPIVMVLGSESSVPPSNIHASDRWLLQTQGRSRWRLEPNQHREANGETWLLSHDMLRRAQQKLFNKTSSSSDEHQLQSAPRCEKSDFPILLEPGDALYAPAGFVWSGCLGEQLANHPSILVGAVGPTRHLPAAFVEELAKVYGGSKEVSSKTAEHEEKKYPPALLTFREKMYHMNFLEYNCRLGNVKVVKDLINNHGQNATDNLSNGCMVQAVASGHEAIVKFLLKTYGTSLLSWTVEKTTFRSILTTAVSFGFNGLEHDIELPLAHILKYIVDEENKRPRSTYNILNQPDGYTGLSPLRTAISYWQTGVVGMLLGTPNVDAQSPFPAAAAHGRLTGFDYVQAHCDPLWVAAWTGVGTLVLSPCG